MRGQTVRKTPCIVAQTVTPESPLPEEIVQLLSLGFAVVYEPGSLSLCVTDFDRSTERGFCFSENRHARAGQLYVSPGRSPRCYTQV